MMFIMTQTKKILALLSTLLFITVTLILSVLGVLQNFIFNRRKFDNLIVKAWGLSSCFLFRVKVKVHHPENLQKTPNGAILLFNHSSFMDVLAMTGFLHNIRFGAKIELFKIPFFGLCIKRFGTLPIARDNKHEVIKVYAEAKIRFSRGERFALSPEGGRFFGEKLFPFKSGPFIFAINSKVPLIPVVIKGAYDVWPKGEFIANSNFSSKVIDIYILPEVSTRDFKLEDRFQLQEKIYHQMNDLYTFNSSHL